MRRMGLEEKRRKFPRSFFGKKDLADLTSSLMKRLCRAGAEPIPLRCIPVRCNFLHHDHRRVHAVLQLMHSACRRLAAAGGVCHRGLGLQAFPQGDGGKDRLRGRHTRMHGSLARPVRQDYIAGCKRRFAPRRASSSKSSQRWPSSLFPPSWSCGRSSPPPPLWVRRCWSRTIWGCSCFLCFCWWCPPVRPFGGDAAIPYRHYRHQQQHRAHERYSGLSRADRQ